MINFWQHAVPGLDDQQFVQEELQLATMAEDLGFDFLGMPEHHFEDYSMCVDNLQALSYVAARTTKLGLMTAVVVLPWHDPIRVAEKLILLDHLSNGRAMFGMGRGLAPKEYAAFRIDQNEAKDRFGESAEMIIRALKTGVIEGNGPYYTQPREEIRPRPFKPWTQDRLFGVANSPSSAEQAGRLGCRLTMFVAEHIEDLMPNIELWRQTWRENHDSEPPAPLFSDFTFCTRDEQLAEQARQQWFPKAWNLVLDHYDIQRVDFAQIKGYEAHAQRKERAAYADTQVWGAPEEIVDAWKRRLEIVGGTRCRAGSSAGAGCRTTWR